MASVAMRRIGRIAIVLVALSVVMSPAAGATSGGLLGQLQCPCDCGKYLSVCDCSTADRGRSFVQDLEEQGLTNAEIAEEFGQQFGEEYVEFVPKQGSGLSLWVTPLVGVILGAGGVYAYVTRFRDSGSSAALSICPDCGNELADGVEYCPHCGSIIEDSW